LAPLKLASARFAPEKDRTKTKFVDRVLRDAESSGVDLSGAILDGASFLNANLSGADLTGTSLTNADFTVADLRGAVGFSPDERP
jgi:uncharacterized protein YjbI with pentapeptide repeats